MKKILLSIIGAVGLVYSSSAVNTSTTVVLPGTLTNLLSSFPGSVYVKQVTVSANATNGTALLYDTPTNSLTYVLGAYTNVTKYATNYYTYYTNYYGATTYSYTNVALLSLTNTISASTNSYPVRMGVAALASTSVTYGAPSGSSGYLFQNGIWVTNTSVSPSTLTITVTY